MSIFTVGTNQATYTDPFTFSSSKSLSLDGSSGHVTIAHTSGLPIFTTSSSFTFCSWIKPNASVGGGRWLFSMGDTTSNNPVYGLRSGTTANTRAIFVARNLAGTPLIQQPESSTSVFTSSTWQHLIAMFTATTYAVYINNILLWSGSYTDIGTLGATNTTLGALIRIAPATEFWQGLLYDTRMYTGTLSDSLRNEVYHGRTWSTTRLKLWLDYDDRITDQSGFGNNGTLQGTASYSTDIPS